MGASVVDLRSLRALLGRLDQGLADDSAADEFLALACRTFGSVSAAVVQGTTFAPWSRQVAIPSGWPEWHDRYVHQDHAAVAIGRAPVGTPFLICQETKEADLDTDLHAGFARTGLHDCAMLRIYAPHADDLILVLYRTRAEPEFGEEERALLEMIYPRIAGAFAGRRAVASVEQRATPHVWLSFPERRVIWTAPGRRVWTERLGEISPDGWRRIERAIVRAAARFCTERIGGRSQRVRADLRLELAFVAPARGETHRILVLFQDEKSAPEHARGPELPAEELLSPAQLTVARATAGGWSAVEIARSLRISEETVRSHLKEIYRRLGVARSELAGLVVADLRPRRGLPHR